MARSPAGTGMPRKGLGVRVPWAPLMDVFKKLHKYRLEIAISLLWLTTLGLIINIAIQVMS